MTVYVDDMYLYPMGEFKRGPRTYKMSHMIADLAMFAFRKARIANQGVKCQADDPQESANPPGERG